ncbi:MAG: hypothetical protein H0X49_14770 [Acidobacteria bacterium]|nr:hypothetical protein [Acidobacteriota bacterium]
MKKLFYGDNLDVLRKFVRDETVDLCYIDPPFNSKRNYNCICNNNGKLIDIIELSNSFWRFLNETVSKV